MAGYSGTPLVRKFGITSGDRVWLLGEPEDLDIVSLLQPLPTGVTFGRRKSAKGYQLVILISDDRGTFERRLPEAMAAIDRSGTVWAVWPKKASARFKCGPRDLTEDVVRELAIANGLVDVKVCAVDETWSGLKLVYRLSDR